RAFKEALDLRCERLLDQFQLLLHIGMANGVGDPGVAETVDGDGPRAVTDLDLLGFAGIARREARHRVRATRDPDPILLINGEMERRLDLKRAVNRFAILRAAKNLSFRGVSLRHINDLALFVVERPDVAIRRDDDALHLTELSAEVIAGRG